MQVADVGSAGGTDLNLLQYGVWDDITNSAGAVHPTFPNSRDTFRLHCAVMHQAWAMLA